MTACEKCWDDAYWRMLSRGGSQAEHYRALLEERKDAPCATGETTQVHSSSCGEGLNHPGPCA